MAGRVMKRSDRHEWLLNYLIQRQTYYTHCAYAVNVLDRAFVDAYVEATGAKVMMMAFGADKCPMLGRDLSDMCKSGSLKRSVASVQGMGGMGFPTWVWDYALRRPAC